MIALSARVYSVHGEISERDAPLQHIASYVLPAAVMSRATLESDQTIARRHLLLLVELERLVAESRLAFEQSLLDNLPRYPTPERDYELAVALERAVRAVVYPARARLNVGLDDVPDSVRTLADCVMNVAAPLEGASQVLGDLHVLRGYTEEARAAARRGEQLYELGMAEQFDQRIPADQDSVLHVIRRLALLGALRSALRTCLAAAQQCERFALMCS